jgi:hypothetical protein
MDVSNLMNESDILIAKANAMGTDGAMGRMKMEVVIPVKMGSTTQREPGLDVFS